MAYSANPNLFVESLSGGLRAGSAITDLLRRKRDDRELTRLAQLAKQGDYEGAGAGLMGLGEVNAGVQTMNIPYNRQQQELEMDFRNRTLADSNAWRERNFLSDEAYRNANLDLERANAALRAAEANQREAPPGYEYTEEGALRPLPGGPADPAHVEALESARAGAKNKNRERSAFEKQEIAAADNIRASAQNVVSNMQEAIKLNEKAYSGFGASARGYVAAQAGSEAGMATEQLDNIIQGGALESLKATFGAAPTEGERKILMDIQGSSAKDPKTREAIFTRAMAASLARAELNARKAQAMRNGEYFDADFDPNPRDYSLFMGQAEKMVKDIKAQAKTNDSKGQEQLPKVSPVEPEVDELLKKYGGM